MPLFRILALSLVGSLSILHAAAQSPTTPPLTPTTPAPIRIVPFSTAAPLLFVTKPAPATAQFTVPKPSPPVLSAQNSPLPDSPCFSLRTYNFTARDLESPTPRPSRSTTCTPASAGSLKDATASVWK